MTLEDQIILRGVQNLKEYGYQNVDEKNIITDRIYSAFFLSMLEDNLGKGADEQITALIEKVKNETR